MPNEGDRLQPIPDSRKGLAGLSVPADSPLAVVGQRTRYAIVWPRCIPKYTEVEGGIDILVLIAACW
jgi:hypothetical protein